MKRFAPAFFVLLWSTGFLVARYATRDAGALSFLTVRTAIAAVILGTVALVTGETPVTGSQRRVMMGVGLGMHAMYLGGVFFAIEHGMPSGMSALIAAMHPVLTTVFAWLVLGEKLNRIRALGVCLGVTGVVFVVIEHGGTGDGVTAPAMWAMVAAVVGMSTGTLVQRQFGQGTPLLRGTAWQYASTTVALGLVAVFGEGWRFEMTANTLWSLAWAVGVLSIAAILIMLWRARSWCRVGGRVARHEPEVRQRSTAVRSGPITISPEKCSAAIACHSASWPGWMAGTKCVSNSVFTFARAAVCAACCTVEW